MSVFEQLIAWQQADPTRRACVNVTILGDFADGTTFGVVRAAQIDVIAEEHDFTGKPIRRVLGPFVASAIPSEASASMAQLVGAITIQQQQTIDVQTATIASLTADKVAMQSLVDQQAATLAEQATAMVAATTKATDDAATIADLQRQIEAAPAMTTAPEASA